MAPQVKHDGFLVPNAGGSGVLPRMAEVDQVDFNTLSQTHKYAVIEGCKVSVTVTSASTPAGGIAIVNGVMVKVKSSSTASIGAGKERDRFDLIGVDMDGNLRRVDGEPSFDPVFPDPPVDVTILAAVFCPAGAGSFSDLVIDKRVMAPSALLTRLEADKMLVRNVEQNVEIGGPLVDVFTIRGDGIINWTGDTKLERSASATLKITNNLTLPGFIQAGADITAENLTARRVVTARNIFTGGTGAVTGTEPKGALRQDPNGSLYVNSAAGWVELATVNNTAPVGTILSTVRTRAEMPPAWVQLNGDTIAKATYPNLFDLDKLQEFILPNGVEMKLPDFTNRSLVGSQTNIGETGRATVALTAANLAPHKHNVKTETKGISLSGKVGGGGGHTHTQAADSGGHDHDIDDPEHRHEGMDFFGYPAKVIAMLTGGKNKLDAEFNDRNHTHSVEAYLWTMAAKTGIKVLAASSAHKHALQGVQDHSHGLTMNPVDPHNHEVNEDTVGSSAPFDIRPLSFFVFMYIKS